MNSVIEENRVICTATENDELNKDQVKYLSRDIYEVLDYLEDNCQEFNDIAVTENIIVNIPDTVLSSEPDTELYLYKLLFDDGVDNEIIKYILVDDSHQVAEFVEKFCNIKDHEITIIEKIKCIIL